MTKNTINLTRQFVPTEPGGYLLINTTHSEPPACHKSTSVSRTVRNERVSSTFVKEPEILHTCGDNIVRCFEWHSILQIFPAVSFITTDLTKRLKSDLSFSVISDDVKKKEILVILAHIAIIGFIPLKSGVKPVRSCEKNIHHLFSTRISVNVSPTSHVVSPHEKQYTPFTEVSTPNHVTKRSQQWH